jgi:CAAX prenyl protease-like protein
MSFLRTQERPPGRSEPREPAHPALPYVLPFAVFFLLLFSADLLDRLLGEWEFPIRVLILGIVLWVSSRHVIDLHVRQWGPTLLVGLAVFAIWVAPDVLFPAYRSHWLFQNPITGSLKSSIPTDLLKNPVVLVFRAIRAVVIVPIVEELFWRAWLFRWLVNPNFQAVPLGTYTPAAMWISAFLFASEHGPYWEVGLVAGLIYNWWLVRTKSLGDCILAHAVTNAALSVFVVLTGRWEYWL